MEQEAGSSGKDVSSGEMAAERYRIFGELMSASRYSRFAIGLSEREAARVKALLSAARLLKVGGSPAVESAFRGLLHNDPATAIDVLGLVKTAKAIRGRVSVISAESP